MEKRKYITYEQFEYPAPEDYKDCPYVVEDDVALQPAVALQAMIARHGSNALLTGYASKTPDTSTNVDVYPDIHAGIDNARKLTGAINDSLLKQRKEAAKKASEVKEVIKDTAQAPVLDAQLAEPPQQGA